MVFNSEIELGRSIELLYNIKKIMLKNSNFREVGVLTVACLGVNIIKATRSGLMRGCARLNDL